MGKKSPKKERISFWQRLQRPMVPIGKFLKMNKAQDTEKVWNLYKP